MGPRPQARRARRAWPRATSCGCPTPASSVSARRWALGASGRASAVGRDLLDTMRAHPGCVGLAAPQLGELVRMVAVDVTDHPKATTCAGELVLVDPHVVCAEGRRWRARAAFRSPT